MKKLLTAALVLTAGLSMSAHASLISGPITFDGGKLVNLQGLEWMPVTYTAGLSRDDVELGFSDVTKEWGKGGWRYATRNETNLLLGSLWGGRYDGWSYDNFAGASKFLEIFGHTWINNEDNFVSAFLFGEVGACNVNFPSVCYGQVGQYKNYPYEYTAMDKLYNWLSTTSYVPGQAGMGWFSDDHGVDMARGGVDVAVGMNDSSSILGSLLVRSGDTPVATVSSPAALSLLALGLCGLLLRRRKIAA